MSRANANARDPSRGDAGGARRGTLRSALQSALLVAVSGCGALLAAEGVVRAFPGLLPTPVRIAAETNKPGRNISDPVIGHRLEPNSSGTIWTTDFRHGYETDSRGFRNAEPWPATVDVVVIGDSLVFGYGVERKRAWPQLLARELDGRSVLNLGLIGAGPQQYRRVFTSVAKSVAPQLVIVGLFTRNDFWDAELFDEWRRQGAIGSYMTWRSAGRTNPPGWSSPLDSLRYILHRHSRVYTLARFGRSALRDAAGRDPQLLPWGEGTTLELTLGDMARKTVHADPLSPVFRIAMGSIARLRDEAAAVGARTVVVMQPGKEEVYAGHVDVPPPDTGAAARQALDELGIEHLDLLPAFRAEAAEGAQLFYATDGHPNAAGYRLIAERVSAWLKKKGLAEAPAPRAGPLERR